MAAAAGAGPRDASETVDSLTVLDYYNNSPDKQIIQKGMDTCAKQLAITIKRETVPGDTLSPRFSSRPRPRPCPTC